MITEMVVICIILIFIGIQIYYFTCRRPETSEEEMVLLD